MKITVIHGQSHRGSTYNITKQIIDNIPCDDKEIYEYFMPKDGPRYCVGCYKCFMEGEDSCPQAEKVQAIVKSMELSDIIVIDSPAYCMEMTGQLKTFFDHIAYMWISHRPRKSMFNKVGIVVSTTAGAGAKNVTKSLARQMFYIGIPKVFKYSRRVSASNWEMVPDKIKQSIDQETSKIAVKAKAKAGKLSPGFRSRFMFSLMRGMQKSNNWNVTDRNYWMEKGWLNDKRPWK